MNSVLKNTLYFLSIGSLRKNKEISAFQSLFSKRDLLCKKFVLLFEETLTFIKRNPNTSPLINDVLELKNPKIENQHDFSSAKYHEPFMNENNLAVNIL